VAALFVRKRWAAALMSIELPQPCRVSFCFSADVPQLTAMPAAGDVLGANAVLMDAYNTDVRSLLADLREQMGLDPNPMAAYAASGYAEKIAADRVGGQAAGWGA
jgi:L-rhamnose isomerase/sugar isomerase